MNKALSVLSVSFVFVFGFVDESPLAAQGMVPPEAALDERFCADSNGDGSVNISDPVAVLNSLFSSGPEPYCIRDNVNIGAQIAELEASLAAANDANAGLTTDLAAANTDIAVLSTDLAAAGAANDALTATNSTLTASLAAGDAANIVLSADLAAANDANAGLTTDLAAAGAANDALTATNGTLTADLAAANAANDALTAANGTLTADLAAAGAANDALTATNGTLTTDLAAAGAANDALTATNGTLTADLAAANTANAGLTTDLAAAGAANDALTATNGALTADLAAANTDIAGLTTDLAAANDSIASLNDRVVELVVEGCMDPEATNYDPLANVDDGSCYVPTGFAFTEVNAEGQNEYSHSDSGLTFVLIPGGEFEMGSPADEADRGVDEAQHTVTLSPFLLSKHEVNQADYEAVMTGHATLDATPSFNAGAVAVFDQNRPVEGVSWADLKDADGYLARTGLSLPSEAQWEYACRAGALGRFAGHLVDMAWTNANTVGSHKPVGTKAANQFGLHDMHGNVFEWTEDYYAADFYTSADAGGPDPVNVTLSPCGTFDPTGEGCRSVRGGAFTADESVARSARRFGVVSGRLSALGFRPAMPLSP